ncbi:MAG: FGGY-family carbohydrate kinase [Candidatus Caldatribacterium sp.]|nr:FGGY-family carbohydrate kinase [Candidatus Caldatribacterium sp.]
MAVLTYDIGTSAIKVALFSPDGAMLATASCPLTTRISGRKVTQNPKDWWEGFLKCARQCLEAQQFEELTIIGTGQMEDFLLLDALGNPIGEASLYSSADADEHLLPEELRRRVEAKVPNKLDSFTPFVKAFAAYRLSGLENVQYLIFGAKDYVNFCLTGVSATDPTNAATTSFLDAHTMSWVEEGEPFLPLLPKLIPPTEVIGTVREEILTLLGLEGQQVLVLNGIGDLGAVTLGAGITSPGEGYVYLGTTGWAALLARERAENNQLFSLAFVQPNEWVIVAPLLNLGSAYQWSLRVFLGKDSYAESERALIEYLTTPVQAWPYLCGERTPYRNEKVRAVITRLESTTCKEEIHAAFVRSLLFALRHAFESLPKKAPSLRVIGGLTRSTMFLQCLADVLGVPCHVVGGETFAPQRGLYALFLLHRGITPPPVPVERTYFPREHPLLECLYREYRDFAEKLLQGVECFPGYLP